MTQKRGLGRGLGSLIPSAAPQTSSPDRVQSEEPAPATNRTRARQDAAADTVEEQTLRTRSHPRTAPEPGESGASTRPVDMFFSGEPVAGREEKPSRTSSGRDLADSMARAAAERRAQAAKKGTRKAGAGKSGGTASRTTKKTTTAAAKNASPDAVPSTKAADTVTASTKAAPTEGVHAVAAPAESAPTEAPAVEVEAVDSTPVVEAAPAPTATPEPPSTAEAAEAPGGAETSTTNASSDTELMPVPGAEFAEIPIHEIRENPRNPRTDFDEDALDELAYSLREVGVLQPVVVRPIPATDQGESFELVMGERRWRAAQRAGLTSVPAIIRATSDDDLLRDALLENLHRSQLNPLEEAAAYQQLLEDFGCTQDELAERIGRSRPQISNTLRLMKLPPLVQRRLGSGALSAGHARALLSLDSPALMEELAQRIVAEGLSVRAVERLVARGAEGTTPRAAAPRRSSYDPRVVEYTSRLSNRLEAPVRIDVGKRKGRITMEFTNLGDLERLMDRLGLAEAGESEQTES